MEKAKEVSNFLEKRNIFGEKRIDDMKNDILIIATSIIHKIPLCTKNMRGIYSANIPGCILIPSEEAYIENDKVVSIRKSLERLSNEFNNQDIGLIDVGSMEMRKQNTRAMIRNIKSRVLLRMRHAAKRLNTR